MKSKLTLRLDDDLKERAKQLADERGTSVSKIVEDYFRLLLHEPAEETEDGDRESAADDYNTVPDDLPPRTRQMVEALGPATETLDLDDDTRAWIDAAHEKHK
jgi:hypothetical protein